MTYNLKDKVAVVTGAAKGIGASLVAELLEEGVKQVRIFDVDEKAGVLLQDELNSKFGEDKVKFVKCNVTNEEEFYKGLDDAKEENGFIDLLVNNAGVTDESNLSLIHKLIDINFTALINGTLRAIELMRQDKSGRGGAVINISSIAGIFPVSPMFTYSSTKRAVIQFSTCVGGDPCQNTGVRVIAICYGVTDTSILGSMNTYERNFDEKLQHILGSLPVQNTQSAARGTIEVFQKGESASTWLIHSSFPAQDITPNLMKADADVKRILVGSES